MKVGSGATRVVGGRDSSFRLSALLLDATVTGTACSSPSESISLFQLSTAVPVATAILLLSHCLTLPDTLEYYTLLWCFELEKRVEVGDGKMDEQSKFTFSKMHPLPLSHPVL